MAYRFNPPPNWPIEDPNWTPPPGWQPDPSWGPAPEGWNFWVDADADAPAPDQPVDGSDGGDDATRVAPTGGGTEPGPQDDATRAASPDHSDPDAPAQQPRAEETAEYPGPDLEAGFAQQTPYEAGSPGSDQAAATPDHGQAPLDDGTAGYGQAPPDYSAGYAAADYGQASPDYGQAPPDYGAAYGAPAYDQGSPAPGYGQGSPAPGYGQGSPAPGYGQGSPGGEGAPGTWAATGGTGEPPQKGIVARFWWVGCIVLFLVVMLIIAVIGGIVLLNNDGGEPTGGGGTTTQDQTTQSTPTDESPTEDTPTEETTSEEEVVTPTNLPTVDSAAEPVDIVSEDGTGTLAVDMQWLPAEELPSVYGGTVEPAPDGEYLVVTAQIAVTEGTMELQPYAFEVVTPYGGTLTTASATYGLEGSGLDADAPTSFEAGEEYTIRMLFDPSRAGGMTLEFNTWTDVYSWDVPA